MIVVAADVDPRHLRVMAPGPVLLAPWLASSPAALQEALLGADALVVRNLRVDETLLDHGPGLRVVGRLGSGLDNIDQAALAARGIVLVHAPGANAEAVADYTLWALLTAARRLDAWATRTREGSWLRGLSGHELGGRTLALIGYGRVGRAVARRAAASGLTVVVSDPRHPAGTSMAQDPAVLWTDTPADAVERGDFVSLHVPLTAATRGFLDASLLRRFRRHAWLINTSRGAVVNEADLLTALTQDWLQGAVLDVRTEEPPGAPDALAAHPRVIVTPHIAGMAEEAQDRIAATVLRGVREALERTGRGGAHGAAPRPTVENLSADA